MDSVAAEAEGCPSDQGPPQTAIPRWLLFVCICICLPRESLQGPHEKRLLHTLLDHYNVLERPVANESDPLQLSFGLTLMQIIDVDEKNQLLITNIWLKLEWNDVNLRWNSSEYGGVKDLRIPPHRIWKPDVLMYNSADEGFDGTYPTNVVVRNNGSCLYVPPGIFKSTCKIDITWFPFDDQRCEMKFGSWTYDGFQLDLQLQDDSGGDISSFITNGEWDLLGVTILLSLTVFLNMVAETMPATSDAVPLLGTYFNCIMFMVASSVVSTILILNYHHRNADTHEMSPWIKAIFLHWLPCILRMSRPGAESDSSRKTAQKREMELKERSSKSLLANVLDIDDDFRHHPGALQTSSAVSATGYLRGSHAHHDDGGGGGGTLLHGGSGNSSTCLGPHRELTLILKELRVITDKLRKEDEAAEVTNDWKFAAMVVDRLCLIIFTLFTVIATIAVLFSAPHIIVT
ncbi:neuronal acetylcholine receptor subunit alpha-7-like isoform X8 [Zootermopsis nevadensis]|uniref:neuronal acetylcholine receptor subunit alpha-7-like isoform X8 n=1 Tax=Zootermopsis nevadensis TaxID=136037 RepID=UPI000B8EB225|nr:neuronal acetylcholine receptor subunit alpha-7-like isoform X8 [Zootermopsis nevadensis]